MLSRRKLLQQVIAEATVVGSGIASAGCSWPFLSMEQSRVVSQIGDSILSKDLTSNQNIAEIAATDWLIKSKYGIFIHYQYRILLGYSVKTDPQFPDPAKMKSAEWNKFVDGFDVRGFAEQMAAANVGWVIFCLDDHYFAWQCAPNKTFSEFTGYAPGEKCSHRDLIVQLADVLSHKGIKLIVYFAGLNGYMKEPKVSAGLMDARGRGNLNQLAPPSAECRRRRLAVLKEYASRYREKIAGWWFDGIELDTYKAESDNWQSIYSIVHEANPKAVIAFSYGRNEQACICEGIDNYTGGDDLALRMRIS